MFNRDGIFGKKDENPRREGRGSLGQNPAAGNPPAPARGQSESPLPNPQQARESIKDTAKTDETKGSKLIVGPDIKLKGVEITDCDTLVVEGRVEAAMDSRVIKIAEHGVFCGTAGVDVAEIRGRFEGELTARKQLVILSTGRASGKIHYGKIAIEEGGELAGEVDALSSGTAAGTSRSGDSRTPPSADIMTPYDPFARKARLAQPEKS